MRDTMFGTNNKRLVVVNYVQVKNENRWALYKKIYRVVPKNLKVKAIPTADIEVVWGRQTETSRWIAGRENLKTTEVQTVPTNSRYRTEHTQKKRERKKLSQIFKVLL